MPMDPEEYRTITVRKVPELPGMDGITKCDIALSDSSIHEVRSDVLVRPGRPK